jgi:hypothetical protein
LQLVEEKVTGDDEASQALVSPHDIDELERVVSWKDWQNLIGFRGNLKTSSMIMEDLNNGSREE